MSEPSPDQTPTTPADAPATTRDTMPMDEPPQTPVTSRSDAPPAVPGEGSGLRLPPRLGAYLLLGEIAHGGQGVICRARHEKLGSLCAVKVLIAGEHASLEAIARFKREAAAVAKMGKHPNIVCVHDLGQEGALFYIVMELIEGRTLRQRMHEGALTSEQAAVLVEKVARAIHFVHQHGVIHRDIKPENIQVRTDGEPQVMDFGLAKDARTEERLTARGMVWGTADYMAPEQVYDDWEAIDAQTDVYALGGVLYELLTGIPPNPSRGVDASDPTRWGDPIRPHVVNRGVPRDLETVALKCLLVEKAQRYATAEALADDLACWLRGEPITARPISAVARLWRKTMRNRRVVVPIASVVIAALTVIAVVVTQGSRRRRVDSEVSRLLEQGRGPLDQAEVYLYHEGADYEEMRKHVQEGKRLIEQALAKAPDNALGHDLLGRAWQLLGWEGNAESCYRDAIRIDPQLGAAHFHLGMLLLDRAIIVKTPGPGSSQAEAEDRATAFMRRASAEFDVAAGSSWTGADDLVRALLPIAQAFVAGQMRDVVTSTAEATSRFGDRPGCERLYLLAALGQDGEPRRTALDAALRICPGDTLARFKRGRTRYDIGDFKGAMADYDQAIAVNPRFVDALNNRGMVRAVCVGVDSAIADYDQALAIDPHYTWALLNRGAARMVKNDPDGAIRDYDQALAIDPQFVGAMINRACAREAKNDPDGSIADCDRALAIDPRCVGAFVNRASARQDKGDLDGAIADCDQALAIDPRCAEAFAGRGTARKDKGDLDGAIRDLDQALAINPRLVTAYDNRGVIFRAKGDTARALADYERALAIDPWHANAYVCRGNVREDSGDWDDAIADFNKALTINPNEAAAYAGRGLALRGKGDQEGALADFDQALRIDPRRLAACLGRGLVRSAKGDLDGAMQDLDQAIRINARYSDAFAVRGLVRQAKGDLDGAVKDYTKALELAPAEWPKRKQVEEALRAAREKRTK